MSALFRADDVPLKWRVDYFQHVVSNTMCPIELRPGGPDLRDRLHVGELGAVRVVDLTFPQPGGAERTMSHIRQSDSRLFTIDVQVRGRLAVEQRRRQTCLSPGDFTLVDPSQPARWDQTAAQTTAVVFPPSLLPLGSNDLARLTGVHFSGRRGLGALVSSLVRQLPGHLDEGDAADRARLGTAVLDLLASVLASRLDRDHLVPPTTQQRVLLLRIHAFIDANLGDPKLSPQSIAAANAISVRYLHKLFETEPTTVADWIRRRRLERCRRDLLDPALSTRPVSAIAARWGLTDPAGFNRLFRATYQFPPGQYRRVHRQPPMS